VPARTLAVLGARDSGSRELAARLTAPAAREGVRVLVDARPEHAPDCALVTVDAVCPIRPDDVAVLAGVASRVPVLVVLTGAAGRDGLERTLDVTVRRLRAAGVPAPVHVLASETPAAEPVEVPTTDVAGLLAATRPGTLPPLAVPTTPAPSVAAPAVAAPAADPGAVPDWLAARRTEVIAGRSAALRQDVQALRLELVQDLHRGLRDLGARAREEIGAAPVRALPGVVTGLAGDADAAAAQAVDRADRLTESLVTRHLGTEPRQTPRVDAPRSGLALSDAPRHRGEELLMLAMGAAGGTGVGRMLLSPLAEIPGLAAAVLPLALVAGVLIGGAGVAVRRTQARRAHMIAVATDRLAGLRAETEQALGARVLEAEAQVTDGFAHDPGPRVADLERRLRRLRTTADRPRHGGTTG